MSMYMHACVYMFAYVSMCRPEVDIECLLHSPFTRFFETDSLTQPGDHRMG